MNRRRLIAVVDHLTRAAAYSALAVVLLLAATVTPPAPPTEPFVPRQVTEQEERQHLAELLEEVSRQQ